MMLFLPAANAVQTFAGSNTLSLAELQKAVSDRGQVIRSFRLEGVVCAVVREQKMIVLQDNSAAALIELPGLDETVAVGERVAIEGDSASLTRSRYGIRLGSALVVDNDGSHPALMKSGSAFLTSGLQPFRLSWFNGQSNAVLLSLEYEGPGVQRQPIPESAWWHGPAKTTHQVGFQPGVHFASYVGAGWYTLPEFESLRPLAEGIATNIDLACRARDENTALVFDGDLNIERPGRYSFYLTSSSGSRLYVGNSSDSCEIVQLGAKSTPVIKSFEQALAQPGGGQWVELEGVVTFAGRNNHEMEIEISTGNDVVPVTVMDGSTLTSADLLDRHIRVVGICETSYDLEQKMTAHLVVPDAGQIQGRPEEAASLISPTNAFLTAAAQVQRLKPEQAGEQLRVKLKGVVTQASPNSLVLQDSSGGVFVHYTSSDWVNQPRVGELWEIEGTTDPGDFSPVIFATKATFLGEGVLPKPIQPTWDQLLNGSLDAQYVEIQGIVTAVSEAGMTLLTRNGKIQLEVEEMGNSYRDGRELFIERHAPVDVDGMRRAYQDSVVRIRGCLVAVWNQDTRQVVAGQIRLMAAVISVDQPKRMEPFSLPTTQAADLLLFHAHSSAFQRIKVAGQLIYARPGEYYLLDGHTGLRLLTDAALTLQTGDLVEAVGFSRLGGPAPILQAAEIQKTGHAPLPLPVRVSTEALLDRSHDTTLVQIDATLINDKTLLRERVLELQAGSVHFIARLRSNLQSLPSLSAGSRLRLTGVYDSSSPDQVGTSADAFELLLNSGADIAVLQQPSWWNVRHALMVAAALAGALCFTFVWITVLHRKVEERTVQLQEEIENRQLVEQHRLMEQERIRVARDLHDELGAGLTEVGILGALAKNPAVSPEEKKHYLDQLTEAASALVTGLDEIVWAINPHYDSVGSLATYYSLFAQRFLNLAGIACRLQVAESLPEYPLESKLRHGIFLAFKEALNNVVRHSGAGQVEIRIEVVNHQLLIGINDNGRGLVAVNDVPGSDGLAGMRERLRQLGGDCRIENRAGGGTSVEFRIHLTGAIA